MLALECTGSVGSVIVEPLLIFPSRSRPLSFLVIPTVTLIKIMMLLAVMLVMVMLMVSLVFVMLILMRLMDVATRSISFLLIMTTLFVMICEGVLLDCQNMMRVLSRKCNGDANHVDNHKDNDEMKIPHRADIILSSDCCCQLNCKTAGPAIPRA